MPKNSLSYKNKPDFCKIIDEAVETAPPEGSRHNRPVERRRIKLVINTLNDVMTTGIWVQEPGTIIASYLVGEEEAANATKNINQTTEDIHGNK